MVITAAVNHIEKTYELGALHSELPNFYKNLGWERWRGPTFVRTDQGLIRTQQDDKRIHVWRVTSTPTFNLDDPISCEWRPGFAW